VEFVQVGGHRLEVMCIDAVRRDAPGTLVFLHEGLGSNALWKDFPARVAQVTGCGAVIYSRYGYGRSDRLTSPREVDYMHREALEVLPEVLERLAIRNPVLIGHSDGASIALIHAGAHAGPVRAVVAMAPHVFVEDVTVRSIAEAKAAFEVTDLRQRLGRYHDHVDSAFRGWNDIWLHPDFRRWNIEAYLPGVACPVLLIQGEDDQYGTAAQVEAIARQVSGPARILMLPGCAHSPHLSAQKQAAIAAIAGFVEALPKPD